MTQTLYIPSSAITGPSISDTPDGALVQRSTKNPTIVTVITKCKPNTFHSLDYITVDCLGERSAIKYVSVNFGDIQVLADTYVSNGFEYFTIPGQRDVKAPGGFQEITVEFKINIPDTSSDILISSITLGVS